MRLMPNWLAPVVVIGIIAFIYINDSGDGERIPIKVAEPTPHNWSGLSGTVSGSVDGVFSGHVQVRNKTVGVWSNLTGVYRGKIYYPTVGGKMRECILNVTGGRYNGKTPIGNMGVGSNYVEVNLSGYVSSWKVSGSYDARDTGYKPPEEESNLDIVLLIIGVAGLGYYLFTQKTGTRRQMDDAEIGDRLSKHLKKEWSRNLTEIIEMHRIPEGGLAEKVNIHFQIDRPYKIDCLCRYNLMNGHFEDFKFRRGFTEIKEFMIPKVEYIEERELSKGFRERKDEDNT